MSKVSPIGGKHQSVSSMLAEAMADPACKRAVICWFDDDGNMSYGHFRLTRKEMAYASVVLAANAVEGDG